MTMRVDPEWWKTLFDEIYLLTDARSVCDDRLTSREVDVICELLPIRPGHRILDLCGGHGRHSLALCERGYENCTVLDYSAYLINQGKACAADRNYPIEFIQGNAQSIGLESGVFDYVLIMGNSLGYTLNADADRLILIEAFRVLRSGGWLLIDAANGDSARICFKPIAWHEIGPDVVVCRQREINENLICSREMVISKSKGLIRDRTYSIRLYGPNSLAALVEEAGFIGIKVKTEFAPHKNDCDYGFMNHRMIVTAQRP
jgi:D-alanine-D-alanine ligase